MLGGSVRVLGRIRGLAAFLLATVRLLGRRRGRVGGRRVCLGGGRGEFFEEGEFGVVLGGGKKSIDLLID